MFGSRLRTRLTPRTVWGIRTNSAREDDQMSRHGTKSITKLTGGLLAVATSVAAATTGAGTAEATCISIGGIGNGGGCTSTAGSIAIAIGAHAVATASGALNM